MDNIKNRLAELKLKLVHGDKNIFLEKIQEQAPCIITEMSTGLIIFASKRVNDIFGYIYNELEGKEVEDLMPMEYRLRHSANLQNYSKFPKYRNMGKEGMTLKGQRKDQTEFDIKIALEPFYEDGEGFVLATIMEV
jgi:PAS domain S-box-containing protein